MNTRKRNLTWLLTANLFLILPAFLNGQDRLQKMPGYEQYQKMSKASAGAVKMAPSQVTWKDGGKSLDYAVDGTVLHYDIAAGTTAEAGKAPAGKGTGGKKGPKGNALTIDALVPRGLFATSSMSADGKRKAFY